MPRLEKRTVLGAHPKSRKWIKTAKFRTQASASASASGEVARRSLGLDRVKSGQFMVRTSGLIICLGLHIPDTAHGVLSDEPMEPGAQV